MLNMIIVLFLRFSPGPCNRSHLLFVSSWVHCSHYFQYPSKMQIWSSHFLRTLCIFPTSHKLSMQGQSYLNCGLRCQASLHPGTPWLLLACSVQREAPTHILAPHLRQHLFLRNTHSWKPNVSMTFFASCISPHLGFQEASSSIIALTPLNCIYLFLFLYPKLDHQLLEFKNSIFTCFPSTSVSNLFSSVWVQNKGSNYNASHTSDDF